MLCFMILGEKNSRNQFLMHLAKIEQILKIEEEIWIKELKPWWLIEENPWMMSILEDLGEIQLFWAVLEERKKKGRVVNKLGDFLEIDRLDL